MRSSVDDNESFKEAAGSLCFNDPPSDPNTMLPCQRLPLTVGGNSSMQPQESTEETRRSEDICFNNCPSDANTLRQMESSSMQPQERSENTTM